MLLVFPTRVKVRPGARRENEDRRASLREERYTGLNYL